MYQTIRTAPPNSLIFISDPNGGVGPEFIAHRLVLSTSSEISVACFTSDDGPTEVTMGSAAEVDPARPPVFDAMLDTPNKSVAVSTSERQVLMQTDVLDIETRVRIWANDTVEPDVVIIGLG